MFGGGAGCAGGSGGGGCLRVRGGGAPPDVRPGRGDLPLGVRAQVRRSTAQGSRSLLTTDRSINQSTAQLINQPTVRINQSTERSINQHLGWSNDQQNDQS